MVEPLVEKHLLEADVYIESDWDAPLFTGKLVKSLLIDAEPRLKEVFRKTRGSEPKLVHITPLFERRNGKIRCIYSYASRKDGHVKRVRIRGAYRFYVGFAGQNVKSNGLTVDEFFDAVAGIEGKHLFAGKAFNVTVLSVRRLDWLRRWSRELLRILARDGKLKLVFSSPTLLRDPVRRNKQKSLVPTTLNIFSTPVYIDLYLAGKLRRKTYLKTLLMLHRVLNETYSIYKTTEIRWVVYHNSRRIIPTLTGYVNLYLNRPIYDEYQARYSVDQVLQTVFETIQTLGTGTSRATGFGHILLESSAQPAESRSAAARVKPIPIF